MHAYRTRSNTCIFCSLRSDLLSWRAIAPTPPARAKQQQTRAFSATAHHQRIRKYTVHPHNGEGIEENQESRTRHSSRRSEHKGVDEYRPLLDLSFGAKPPIIRKGLGGKSRTIDLLQSGRDRKGFSKAAIEESLDALESELRKSPILDNLRLTSATFGRKFQDFSFWLWTRLDNGAGESGDGQETRTELAKALQQTFKDRGQPGLQSRLKYAFYGYVAGSNLSKTDIASQRMLADLRYPSEWYPQTRSLRRQVHLHVGPTNSGKTYQALKRLEEANNGAYAGPLRLLAHEVYTRLNANGRPCALLTGDDRKLPPDAVRNRSDEIGLFACTVEMLNISRQFHVCVIDEIQMIGDKERGWAWSQAVLGVQATELHLCGEKRAVPLIRELLASTGDDLIIHEYERLSPLRMDDESLGGDLKKLRKGDCIVSFSIVGIHALRREIEKRTGKKVAIVYGSLPPETRAQQARLFNDPNNEYDYLVASDAIGMGLNLAIKRVIFEAASKYNGVQQVQLPHADVKQIGGRAGRFRVAPKVGNASESPNAATTEGTAVRDSSMSQSANVADQKSPKPTQSDGSTGLVTTLEAFDFPFVQTCMTTEPPPIKSAGIHPPGILIERFASYFPPETPFSYIVLRIQEISQINPRFHLCNFGDMLKILDAIESVKGLSASDRIAFSAAPCNFKDVKNQELMHELATCIAEQQGGNLADIKSLDLELLEQPVTGERTCLLALENLHKNIITYLWLSFRFIGVFPTRQLAMHVKELVEASIEKSLSLFNFKFNKRRQISAARHQSMLERLKNEIATGDGEADSEEARRIQQDRASSALDDVLQEQAKRELEQGPPASTAEDVLKDDKVTEPAVRFPSDDSALELQTGEAMKLSDSEDYSFNEVTTDVEGGKEDDLASSGEEATLSADTQSETRDSPDVTSASDRNTTIEFMPDFDEIGKKAKQEKTMLEDQSAGSGPTPTEMADDIAHGAPSTPLDASGTAQNKRSAAGSM